jgi:hypothetical protein
MVTPALPNISNDFDIPEGFMQQLVMSIFMLGYAQGPFVLAPLSEIYGRVTVLQYANLIYLVFNTACGFAQTRTQMLVFRFLSGIGGSAPQAVHALLLSDTCLNIVNTDKHPVMQRCTGRYLVERRAWQRPSHLRYADFHWAMRRAHLWRIYYHEYDVALDILVDIHL